MFVSQSTYEWLSERSVLNRCVYCGCHLVPGGVQLCSWCLGVFDLIPVPKRDDYGVPIPGSNRWLIVRKDAS